MTQPTLLVTQMITSFVEKLLGVHFGNQLKFGFHIEKICKSKNGSRKVHAFARVIPYMDPPKKRTRINEHYLAHSLITGHDLDVS